jgi:hypothetical protein
MIPLKQMDATENTIQASYSTQHDGDRIIRGYLNIETFDYSIQPSRPSTSRRISIPSL